MSTSSQDNSIGEFNRKEQEKERAAEEAAKPKPSREDE